MLAAVLRRANLAPEEAQSGGKRGKLWPAPLSEVQKIWQVTEASRLARELIESKLAADDSCQGTAAAELDHAIRSLVLQNGFQRMRPAAGNVAQSVALAAEEDR